MSNYILIFLLSLPSIWAFLPPGYFYTHDGAFHLVRLAHFYNELINRQFPVRWAHDLAFGFGYPVFNYIYPLPYYLGSLFHVLGFPFGESIKMVLILSTLGSSFAMFFWLRCHFEDLPSLVGAVFYLYTPFRFVTNYVTGQIGTSIIFLLIPLSLICINKLLRTKQLLYLPLLAVVLACVLLAHNISILMFLPIMGIYSLYLIWNNRKTNKQSIILLLLATFLGFGLASFFVIPALFEESYVKIGTGQTVNYKDHWPSLKQLVYSKWGYGFSEKGEEKDGLSFQVGIGQWLVIILTIILIIGQKFLHYNLENLSFPLLFLSIFFLAMFLMLSQSDIIWSNIKVMQNIQHPWRLLAIVPLTGGCLASWLIAQRRKWWIAIFFVALVLHANRNHLRTMEITRYSDEHYLNQPYVYSSPNDIAWEYLPIWAKIPPSWFPKQKIEINKTAIINDLSSKKGSVLLFKVNTSIPTTVILNIFYFPSWEVKIDGNKTAVVPTVNTGLVSFNLPIGEHTIKAKITSTQLEKIANWLSLISFLFWLLLIHRFAFDKKKLVKY